MNDLPEKYLSDVIDLEQDILPYRIVHIIAGVGAGKNHWVNQIANTKRKGDANRYSVLLITSRKATANAQASKMKAKRWIDLDAVMQIDQGIGIQRGDRKFVVTNAGIEYFVKNKYKKEDESTHIWNRFDFIILDEAHSLSADAVFADSPFYVHQFLRQAVHKNKNCHVIFMTGTPAPIDWLITDDLKAHGQFNLLDKFKECRHIEPDKVILEPLSSAIFDVTEELKRGKKLIYFARTIARIKDIYVELCQNKDLKKCGFGAENICISFSDTEENIKRAKEMFFKANEAIPQIQLDVDGIIDQMKAVREQLEQESLLPDDVKILITTSTLKEGVDIKNSDVKDIFAESMVPSTVKQMTGRLRNGVGCLRMLYNSEVSRYKLIDYQRYTEKFCFDKINEAYTEYYKKKDDLERVIQDKEPTPMTARLSLLSGLIEQADIVKYIHETFVNIRYDPFTDQFLWYTGREEGNDFDLKCIYQVLHEKGEWFTESPVWIDDELLHLESGETFFQSYFPYSEVLLWDRRYAALLVRRLIQDEGCWDVEITKEQRDALIKKIWTSIDVEILEKADAALKKPPKQPASYLKKFWIELKETPGKRKGDSYIISALPYKKNG